MAEVAPVAPRRKKPRGHEEQPDPTPRTGGPALWTNKSRPYVLEVDPETGAFRGIRPKVPGEPTFRLRRKVPNQEAGFWLEPIKAGTPAHKIPGMPIWEEPDYDPSWSEPVVSEVERGMKVIDPYVDVYGLDFATIIQKRFS